MTTFKTSRHSMFIYDRHDEQCLACDGTGVESFPRYGQPDVKKPCWNCGGTGMQVVSVSRIDEDWQEAA